MTTTNANIISLYITMQAFFFRLSASVSFDCILSYVQMKFNTITHNNEILQCNFWKKKKMRMIYVEIFF